jgi:hypothetical protein
MVAHAWAAPASAVGLVAAALMLAGGARARRVGGVLEVSGGAPWRWLVRRAAAWQAITLGHVVLGRDAATLRACRLHEHVHVRQYERLGLLFFALYAASSAAALLRGGDAYRDNRFEREARRAESLRPGRSTLARQAALAFVGDVRATERARPPLESRHG